jgi:hypothetical protein
MQSSEDRNNKRFLQHLRDSHDDVWRVAWWLNSKGYEVRIPPTTYAKNYEDRLNHQDQGDLYVKFQKEERVEVKGLSAQFTSKDDWPMGNTAIVCAKHSFDNADPKPFFYLLLSADKVHAMFIRSDTKEHWEVREYTDKRYESMRQRFYVCPIQYIKFGNIQSASELRR